MATCVWVQVLDQQSVRPSTDDFGYGNPGVRLDRVQTGQRQSRTPRRNISRLRFGSAAAIGAIKHLVPATFFTFFRQLGRGRPQTGQILVGRMGVNAQSGLLPILAIAFQIHQATQAEKHPGESKALETPSNNPARSSPAEYHSPLGPSDLCLIGHEVSTGSQGHRQSRVVPRQATPFAAVVFSPTKTTAQDAAALQRWGRDLEGRKSVGLFIGSEGAEGSPFALRQALTLLPPIQIPSWAAHVTPVRFPEVRGHRIILALAITTAFSPTRNGVPISSLSRRISIQRPPEPQTHGEAGATTAKASSCLSTSLPAGALACKNIARNASPSSSRK